MSHPPGGGCVGEAAGVDNTGAEEPDVCDACPELTLGGGGIVVVAVPETLLDETDE
jgi:hypothetical protein